MLWVSLGARRTTLGCPQGGQVTPPAGRQRGEVSGRAGGHLLLPRQVKDMTRGWPCPPGTCPAWGPQSQTSGWLLRSVPRLSTSARLRAQRPGMPAALPPCSVPAGFRPAMPTACRTGSAGRKPGKTGQILGEEQAAGTGSSLREVGTRSWYGDRAVPRSLAFPPPPEIKLPRPRQAEEGLERGGPGHQKASPRQLLPALALQPGC